MSNTIISQNMNLPVPVVNSDPGPDYASNVNLCMGVIDAHNHAPGNGVQITPSGLLINSDLSFISNNATFVRSVRFASQTTVFSAAADIAALYVVGVDVYFRDGNGNNIRITQSGGIAGSPGSISNLTSPASAAYSSASSTFIWQSGANTPANLDCASIILRNLVANSFGLTINPPASMASNIAYTLPTIPSVLSFLTMNNSGSISASVPTAGGITSNNISAVNYGISGNCSNFNGSGSSGWSSPVTNLTVTLTTIGKPVILMLIPQGGASFVSGSVTTNSSATVYLTLVNTTTSVTLFTKTLNQNLMTGGTLTNTTFYFYDVQHGFDAPSAGSNTWQVYIGGGPVTSAAIQNFILIATELK